MPNLTSRIKAGTPAVVFVAIAVVIGLQASIASNERTLAGRISIAKSEADKANANLEIEKSKNAQKHADALLDRIRTKSVVAGNTETVEHNNGRIAALEMAIASLRNELASVKKGGP